MVLSLLKGVFRARKPRFQGFVVPWYHLALLRAL